MDNDIEISHADHASRLQSWYGHSSPEGETTKRESQQASSTACDTINDQSSLAKKSSDEPGNNAEKKNERWVCCNGRRMTWGFIVVIIVGAVTVGITAWQAGVFTSRKATLSMSVTSSTTQSPIQLCNGLASNCGWRVNEIMFAGVHNAMSSKSDGFLEWNNLEPLEKALESGFRALLIDSCKCRVVGVALCHEVCVGGYREVAPVFTHIVDFLALNPGEVVIIELQVGMGSFGELMDAVFKIPGFASAVYEHPGIEYDWPLMQDLIDSNKRLIVFQHDGNNCNEQRQCPKGVLNTYTYAFETPYDAKGIEGLMNITETCRVTRGDYRNAFFMSNHFAGNQLQLPEYSIAVEANSAQNLQTRLDACHEMVGRRVNLLVVDFWSVGDVVSVVTASNEALGFSSAVPSMGPSPVTSLSPSARPSLSPSRLKSSMEPSYSPSLSPLEPPTLMPSKRMPSIGPSYIPSILPSESVTLTEVPSTEPSYQRTWSPYQLVEPTGHPSNASMLSVSPLVFSTWAPSPTVPTKRPSNGLTLGPSKLSDHPTSAPPTAAANIFSGSIEPHGVPTFSPSLNLISSTPTLARSQTAGPGSPSPSPTGAEVSHSPSEQPS